MCKKVNADRKKHLGVTYVLQTVPGIQLSKNIYSEKPID